MLQRPQLVYLWQVPDAVTMKVQHTQFTQLAQNLEHKRTHCQQSCKFKTSTGSKHANKESLTGSMLVILLQDRSSQPSAAGSARKWLRMYWRPKRSVMLLLLRRKERLRYFLSEFFFKGRWPFRGATDSAPEPHIKQLQWKSSTGKFFLHICIYIYAATSDSLRRCVAVSMCSLHFMVCSTAEKWGINLS